MTHFKDIIVDTKEERENEGIYEISPLPRGYGNTLANSLRRILLSSLEGGAITQVKIEGIDHEYKAIDGIREDLLEILLNLKNISFKTTSDDPQICKISASGKKTVTAGDIVVTGGFEVMNKDEVIANLTDKSSKLEMELQVERGVGYRDSEGDNRLEKGVIRLDADFSPVLNVTYNVLPARKGQQMNLDKVLFTVRTDGSITPKDAIIRASEILQDFAGKIMVALGVSLDAAEEKALLAKIKDIAEASESETDELDNWKIDDLQLSKRTKTGLISGGYKTIGDLKEVTRQSLLTLPGFGNKSFNEIYDVLKQYNIEIEDENE